jgi:hypothetical protein
VAPHSIRLVDVEVILANVFRFFGEELDLVEHLLATLDVVEGELEGGATDFLHQLFVTRVDLVLLVGAIPFSPDC